MTRVLEVPPRPAVADYQPDYQPDHRAQSNQLIPDAVVKSAVAGDLHAIEWLLKYVRPLVVRYCQARLVGAQRTAIPVDDVAQEVLVALFRALPSYRDQGRPFLAFVYGIAGHKVADARRLAARGAAILVPSIPDTESSEATPEQVALHRERTNKMAELMRRTLSPRQYEILLLRVVSGMSAEEVADAMGTTPGAIRVAQHRALVRLRKAISRGC
jgi:RNA polymerase sigma-70 factor (ECF subfamily)